MNNEIQYTYHENGNVKYKKYFTGPKIQQLHRLNAPALYEYDENNNLIKETYVQNGVRHREDGPSEIIYENNIIIEEHFYIKGERYNYIHDDPEIIKYYPNKSIKQKFYNFVNKSHNISQPYNILYDEDGDIITELYWIIFPHIPVGTYSKQIIYKNYNVYSEIYYNKENEMNEHDTMILKLNIILKDKWIATHDDHYSITLPNDKIITCPLYALEETIHDLVEYT